MRDEGPDFLARQVVAMIEEDGALAVGAELCSEPHGAGGTFPHEVLMTPIHGDPCTGCGARL